MEGKIEKRYPESERVLQLQEQSRLVRTFLEWLKTKNYILCGYSKHRSLDGQIYSPVMISNTTILADFFDIDMEKVESEKEQMIEDMKNGC